MATRAGQPVTNTQRIMVSLVWADATVLAIVLSIVSFLLLRSQLVWLAWMFAAFLALAAICGKVYMVSWIIMKWQQHRLQSHVIEYGDMLVYRHKNGTFEHISAIHQGATFYKPAENVRYEEETKEDEEEEAPALPAPEQWDDWMIVQASQRGESIRAIVGDGNRIGVKTGSPLTYSYVQRIIKKSKSLQSQE